MSEFLQDKKKRMELLKHMILQLHEGQAPEAVRTQLVKMLGQVPYEEVVEVEQQLIKEGLPTEEVLKLCDVHTEALQGAIDTSGAKQVPPGHPVDTFQEENKALRREVKQLEQIYAELEKRAGDQAAGDAIHELRQHFNALMDVEKHYQRKENLLFPFLEKHEITGPPTVMWGKHDEARAMLKTSIKALESARGFTVEEAQGMVSRELKPASEAIDGMVDKEEQILLPMCLDTLDDQEWYQVLQGSEEIGYCLYAPTQEWLPDGIEPAPEQAIDTKRIQLPTGSFSVPELESILNTIPFDVTFVDAQDTVRYFSHGKERIFGRSKAILGRKVQFCHPPKSVDTVERILADFHAGRQDHAHFWINLNERFISIEYFAMRDAEGTYQGTLEVSQDLTDKRKLQGDRRLLAYDQKEEPADDTPAAEAKDAKPQWLIDTLEVETLDARPEIESGGHPLPTVMSAIAKLKPGQAFAIITPFLPAPMIDQVKQKGFQTWTEEIGPKHFITYFSR